MAPELRTPTSGRVFNIQRFSVHDGPGIRTTVFLKGCPLRCLWCHNPESMRKQVELAHVESRCIHCDQCIEACPTGYLAALGEGADVIPACDLCGICVDVCPVEARQLVGRDTSVGELVADILRDRLFYDDSGGGVTFSGGEPLIQADFLTAILEACRREGVHTAVDTSGHVRRRDLLRVAPLTGVFLYDLKHMDDARHRELTGVSNRRILENLEALAEVHDDIWIRVPVIPGLNDDQPNIEATARFAASLPGIRRMHLLPYHANGAQKRERLGQTYELDTIRPPDAAHMETLAGIVRSAGLEPHIGG